MLQNHEDKLIFVLTLIIGAIVGLLIVAFILLTENLGARMYPAGGAAWRRLIIPVLGALVTGFLLSRYFPDARGSGIPQTKTALFLRDGRIRFRTVFGKFTCSSISLASGIALGREGPSVQVGAGIASVLGRWLGLSPSKVKALVPVGASAALAAAFNTPISAVLFSLEEVLGDLHAPVLGSIVLGAATSWMVLHLLLGDEPLFHVPAYQLVHPLEFVFYALLGIAGGLVSVSFTKLLLWLRKHFLRMPVRTHWFLPTVGGLVVGILGWFVPEVLGVGYSHVSQALNGRMAIGMMAVLATLKVVATASAYASGNAGGIFGPSLFIGAMLGGAVGGGAHLLLPDYTGSIGAYALVGMGTAFAGIIRVPLTSVIMIFEITRDYSIIVPLMISNLISYFVSSRLQREPIYEALQRQEGIHLPAGARHREQVLVVGLGAHPPLDTLSADLTPVKALESVSRERDAWPVVGPRGLLGMVTAAQLEAAVAGGRGGRPLGEILEARGSGEPLSAENFPHVHADHSLDVALRRMAESRLNVLPVVSRTDLRDMLSVISLNDVLNAYGVGKDRAPVAAAVPQEIKTGRNFLPGVIAILIVLMVLTGVFSYVYTEQLRARGHQAFQAGNQLLEQGRTEEAIERFRNALSTSHSSEHRLALALALVKAGRSNEAAVYLHELVRENPNNAGAKLGLARIAAQQGNLPDAVTYYHQAIYGSWRSEGKAHRVETRFELASMLVRQGAKRQALTELLALADEVPNDTAARKRVGRILLEIDAARDAAGVFRDLLRQDDRDAEAYAGLGEAQFALEEYASACDAFRRAARWDSDQETIRTRLAGCEKILALDPTLRGLKAPERHARSVRLVAEALGRLETCLGGAAVPADARKAMEEARRALARRRPRSYSDATDANTSLADRLWAIGEATCGEAPADDPVSRVLAKVSR
jgi:CIC family chloride channel protein